MMFRSNTTELENTTIGIKEGVCLPTHCAGNDTRKTCCVNKAKKYKNSKVNDRTGMHIVKSSNI
jgi:hypothetical protein